MAEETVRALETLLIQCMNTRLSLLNQSGRVALETATSPDEDEEQEEDYVTVDEETVRALDTLLIQCMNTRVSAVFGINK